MRVITGAARGRKLKTLPGEEIRPTADRVKEGIFSAVQFDIEGRRFLDMFAGSGQIGIEALSRGAVSCVFIDKLRQAVDIIKENLETAALVSKATVLLGDYASVLTGGLFEFDAVYIDPPYHEEQLLRALDFIKDYLSPAAVIICEHPVGYAVPDKVGDYRGYKQYTYGQTGVTLYRRNGES
ncbi:MAG TPA: 16S rRNA (guanine(966)-N(2))-methyltransferase RsmD [Ruminococcaceae bacterium]|nr:16S rRNA (guanine(966)-N(2))-methyltransferase RsmD [Oscillospiraceae bacterium]